MQLTSERTPNVSIRTPTNLWVLRSLDIHKPTDVWVLKPDERAPAGTAVTEVDGVMVAFRPRRNENEKPEYVQ